MDYLLSLFLLPKPTTTTHVLIFKRKKESKKVQVFLVEQSDKWITSYLYFSYPNLQPPLMSLSLIAILFKEIEYQSQK